MAGHFRLMCKFGGSGTGWEGRIEGTKDRRIEPRARVSGGSPTVMVEFYSTHSFIFITVLADVVAPPLTAGGFSETRHEWSVKEHSNVVLRRRKHSTVCARIDTDGVGLPISLIGRIKRRSTVSNSISRCCCRHFLGMK